jgi:hypothetical protein
MLDVFTFVKCLIFFASLPLISLAVDLLKTADDVEESGRLWSRLRTEN